MEHRGKLELTWVGKYEEHVIEPRILVEDRKKSYEMCIRDRYRFELQGYAYL